MYYNFEDKFNCDTRLKKLEERSGKERARKIMEDENGCGLYRHEYRYEIDGIRYHKCVCGFRNSRLGFYFDLLEKFEMGIMPFPGSYLEQPSKVIEILKRLSFIKNDMELRKIKEQQKKNG